MLWDAVGWPSSGAGVGTERATGPSGGAGIRAEGERGIGLPRRLPGGVVVERADRKRRAALIERLELGGLVSS